MRCPTCDNELDDPVPGDKLLKLAEVRERLGRGDRFVRQLIYDGKLPAVREGNRGYWLVRQSDLNAYLANR